MGVEKRQTTVEGLRTSYLTAGEGAPLVLLHALGDSALDWSWVLPALARTQRVYALDLPGFGDSTKPAGDYAPAFFARFVAAFLDTLGIEQTAVVGNSLGGLVALRLALAEPTRVTALSLVDSAGLGRAVSPALQLPTLPGYGEQALAWGKTPLGAAGRGWAKVLLLFARPYRVPPQWLAEQYRLAQQPGCLEATLAALRAQVDLHGQREVLADQLPHLTIPTLIIWGSCDQVFPPFQARDAVARLPHGQLSLISACGHLPQVERPDAFVSVLSPFLAEHGARH
jgi:pimeloyl-ACP methyl ester carboxylesterase